MTRFSYLEFLQATNGFREKFGRALKSFDIERKNTCPMGTGRVFVFKQLYFEYFQRLNIMIDIASSLEYLHIGYSSLIIHCDLKPNY
ncbi:hypothetical protein CUMW_136260 [Citrus unshiu]|nr:hypothetical protein CUMW_136260 [Citrus unshiu]